MMVVRGNLFFVASFVAVVYVVVTVVTVASWMLFVVVVFVDVNDEE